MNKLFSTLVSSLKAKIQPIITKLRMWSTPAFWTTKVFTQIRQFFAKLFDVKPKNKNDYYTVGRWLVSKRLAFSLVVILGILCALYISTNIPKKISGSDEAATLHTYKYNALPLKFYKGSVNILAHDGHLAFTGQVSKGAVNGTGILYGSDGSKLYEGEFAGNKYNGTGQLNYPDGSLEYSGEFSENLFQGKGSFYRNTGTIEYNGEYETGHRSGQGELYNSTGNLIFTGTFRSDKIVYNELISKTTKDIAAMYTGSSSVYSSADEYCVSMDEIGAVYSAIDGTDSLTGESSVSTVYVLSNDITIGNSDYTSINEITKALGQPDYLGTAWVNLPEAICINMLIDKGGAELSSVSVSSSSELEGVYNVSSYDKDASVYLYTYVYDGLLYSFYCTGAGADDFLMYSIEKV